MLLVIFFIFISKSAWQKKCTEELFPIDSGKNLDLAIWSIEALEINRVSWGEHAVLMPSLFLKFKDSKITLSCSKYNIAPSLTRSFWKKNLAASA